MGGREIGSGKMAQLTIRARELVVPPAIRVFFRVDGDVIRVLHIMRAEQAFPPKGW